ncbi:MAG: glycosyltransferase family 39 protein [Verrucomicrobiota bacterium]
MLDSEQSRALDSPFVGSLLLLLLASALLLPGTAQFPLMDRDEPKFAQATHEMMERETWVVPYLNGEYRFDKPPLSYWWMRVHYWIFGKSEIGARLHSIIAAWLTAVVILHTGRFLYSPRAGLFAGVGWLTCLQVLIHGRLCVADMPMILFVTLSMLAMAKLLFAEEEPKRFGTWFWVLVVGQALGFLAKGPIANVTPLLAFILMRILFWRSPLPWKRLQPVALLVIALTIIGFWGVPALLQTENEFAKEGLGKHVVERGFQPFHNRVQIPVIYYLLTGFLSLFPWSAFFPIALRRDVEKTDHQARSRAFLLSWFLAPHLIFAFYSTQLPHYVMPGFPAFFLLLFASGRWPRPSGKLERRWFVLVMIAIGVLFATIAGIVVFSPFRTALPGMSHVLLAACLAIFLLGFMGLLTSWGKTSRFAFAVVLLGIIIHTALTQLRTIFPAKVLAEKLSSLPPKTKFTACKFTEPSLIFYSKWNYPWKLSSKIEQTLTWLEREGPKACVLLKREWRVTDSLDAWTSGDTVEPASDHTAELGSLEQFRARYNIYEVSGFNSARSSWVELVVLISRRD